MSREDPTDLETWFTARQVAIIVSLVGAGYGAMIQFGLIEVAPDKRDGAMAVAIFIAVACAGLAIVSAIGLRRERARLAKTQQMWNGGDHDKPAR
ncbi:hypothetical protein [Nocardia altamirensis]|uniref:hypothetical protein n=1 Tax=Nocardia altamirensis TaxID=472158 RepID=UPI0008401961|nr:hypothetical protein [Nocardia altamirensis]